MKQIILGIDPGLQHMGWGLIEVDGSKLSFIACGTCSPKPKQPLVSRLKVLHDEIQRVCEAYSPDIAAIEETFVSINGSSTLKLGNARGAILLSLALAKLEVHEYAARLVKKSITGSGRADKDQITMMVQILLPACKGGLHSADAMDALAIAITHAHSYRSPILT